MQQALRFSKPNSDPTDESDEAALLHWLDRLEGKKVTWEEYLQKGGDLSIASRLVSNGNGRSLLHLAVLDNRLDVVEGFKKESSLKFRTDAFGLTPIDLAQFLDRKELLTLLQPTSEPPLLSKLPQLGPFEYLTHPVFELPEGFEQVLHYVLKAKREDKIPPEKIWMGIYFDKEIRNGVHAPVSIRLIDSQVGYGVFAEKKIAPCSFIGEYTGVIRQRKPKQVREKRYSLRYGVWEGKKNFVIDAEERGNFTRFLNHSPKGNLGLQAVYWRGIPRMIFVSLKEIGEGEQLTFDYGPLFWEACAQIPKDLPHAL